MSMDPVSIRRLIIKALFSDDLLLEQLVLKGGNALNLVHRIGSRSSLDVDLSLEGDFPDIGSAQERILGTLERRFAAEGLLVFDENFREVGLVGPNPQTQENAKWGGYLITFKVIEGERFHDLGGDFKRAQRQALITGPNQERNFTVQISKFEYCAGKTEANFDEYLIFVYTPAMIALEKLRAVCQQMPEYLLRRQKTARARDFYDIHAITTCKQIDFSSPETHEMTRRIFEAKIVPLRLMARPRCYREFHPQGRPPIQKGRVSSF